MKIGEEMMDFEDEMLGMREFKKILSGESVWEKGLVRDVECEVVMMEG